MTYFDYVRNLENYAKEYKKLMEETKILKQRHYFEDKLDTFYTNLGDSLYLVEYDLGYARNHPDYSPKEFKQKEFQDTCNRHSISVKSYRRELEMYKEQIKDQEFIDKGTMSGQEFKRKLLEFKDEFQKIISEITRKVGNMWNPKYAGEIRIRHELEEKIKQINNVLPKDDFFAKSNDRTYRSIYIKFKNILVRNKSIWEDMKRQSEKERTF